MREFTREDERKLRIVFDNLRREQFQRRHMRAECRWRVAGLAFSQQDAELNLVAAGMEARDESMVFLLSLGRARAGAE